MLLLNVYYAAITVFWVRVKWSAVEIYQQGRYNGWLYGYTFKQQYQDTIPLRCGVEL